MKETCILETRELYNSENEVIKKVISIGANGKNYELSLEGEENLELTSVYDQNNLAARKLVFQGDNGLYLILKEQDGNILSKIEIDKEDIILKDELKVPGLEYLCSKLQRLLDKDTFKYFVYFLCNYKESLKNFFSEIFELINVIIEGISDNLEETNTKRILKTKPLSEMLEYTDVLAPISFASDSSFSAMMTPRVLSIFKKLENEEWEILSQTKPSNKFWMDRGLDDMKEKFEVVYECCDIKNPHIKVMIPASCVDTITRVPKD